MSETDRERAAADAVDAAETEAFRDACVRFVQPYVAALLKRSSLRPLAGTVHEHRTLLLDTKGKAMVMSVRISFGDLVAQQDLVELIDAAQSAPGKVAES